MNGHESENDPSSLENFYNLNSWWTESNTEWEKHPTEPFRQNSAHTQYLPQSDNNTYM